MLKGKFLSKLLALWLFPALTLPSPALALRQSMEGVEAGLEEVLQSPSKTGLEEVLPEAKWIALWDGYARHRQDFVGGPFVSLRAAAPSWFNRDNLIFDISRAGHDLRKIRQALTVRKDGDVAGPLPFAFDESSGYLIFDAYQSFPIGIIHEKDQPIAIGTGMGGELFYCTGCVARGALSDGRRFLGVHHVEPGGGIEFSGNEDAIKWWIDNVKDQGEKRGVSFEKLEVVIQASPITLARGDIFVSRIQKEFVPWSLDPKQISNAIGVPIRQLDLALDATRLLATWEDGVLVQYTSDEDAVWFRSIPWDGPLFSVHHSVPPRRLNFPWSSGHEAFFDALAAVSPKPVSRADLQRAIRGVESALGSISKPIRETHLMRLVDDIERLRASLLKRAGEVGLEEAVTYEFYPGPGASSVGQIPQDLLDFRKKEWADRIVGDISEDGESRAQGRLLRVLQGRGNGVLIVAREKDSREIAGYVLATENDFSKQEVRIQEIAVRSDLGHRGLGTRLFAEALLRMMERGSYISAKVIDSSEEEWTGAIARKFRFEMPSLNSYARPLTPFSPHDAPMIHRLENRLRTLVDKENPSILALCDLNKNRSPVMHLLLLRFLQRIAWKMKITSAGTAPWQHGESGTLGEPENWQEIKKAALEIGIGEDLIELFRNGNDIQEGNRGQEILSDDAVLKADLILVVNQDQADLLGERFPDAKDKIVLFPIKDLDSGMSTRELADWIRGIEEILRPLFAAIERADIQRSAGLVAPGRHRIIPMTPPMEKGDLESQVIAALSFSHAGTIGTDLTSLLQKILNAIDIFAQGGLSFRFIREGEEDPLRAVYLKMQEKAYQQWRREIPSSADPEENLLSLIRDFALELQYLDKFLDEPDGISRILESDPSRSPDVKAHLQRILRDFKETVKRAQGIAFDRFSLAQGESETGAKASMADLQEELRRSYATRLVIEDGRLAQGTRVTMSSPRLFSLLHNLVTNALDNSPLEKSVHLRLETLGEFGEVVITVSDEGTGIPEEGFQAIFALKEGTDGRLHMGLAEVARIVAIVQGTLGIESELGKGTTFTVRLPIVQTGLEENGAVEEMERLWQGYAAHERSLKKAEEPLRRIVRRDRKMNLDFPIFNLIDASQGGMNPKAIQPLLKLKNAQGEQIGDVPSVVHPDGETLIADVPWDCALAIVHNPEQRIAVGTGMGFELDYCTGCVLKGTMPDGKRLLAVAHINPGMFVGEWGKSISSIQWLADQLSQRGVQDLRVVVQANPTTFSEGVSFKARAFHPWPVDPKRFSKIVGVPVRAVDLALGHTRLLATWQEGVKIEYKPFPDTHSFRFIPWEGPQGELHDNIPAVSERFPEAVIHDAFFRALPFVTSDTSLRPEESRALAQTIETLLGLLRQYQPGRSSVLSYLDEDTRKLIASLAARQIRGGLEEKGSEWDQKMAEFRSSSWQNLDETVRGEKLKWFAAHVDDAPSLQEAFRLLLEIALALEEPEEARREAMKRLRELTPQMTLTAQQQQALSRLQEIYGDPRILEEETNPVVSSVAVERPQGFPLKILSMDPGEEHVLAELQEGEGKIPVRIRISGLFEDPHRWMSFQRKIQWVEDHKGEVVYGVPVEILQDGFTEERVFICRLPIPGGWADQKPQLRWDGLNPSEVVENLRNFRRFLGGSLKDGQRELLLSRFLSGGYNPWPWIVAWSQDEESWRGTYQFKRLDMVRWMADHPEAAPSLDEAFEWFKGRAQSSEEWMEARVLAILGMARIAKDPTAPAGEEKQRQTLEGLKSIWVERRNQLDRRDVLWVAWHLTFPEAREWIEEVLSGKGTSSAGLEEIKVRELKELWDEVDAQAKDIIDQALGWGSEKGILVPVGFAERMPSEKRKMEEIALFVRPSVAAMVRSVLAQQYRIGPIYHLIPDGFEDEKYGDAAVLAQLGNTVFIAITADDPRPEFRAGGPHPTVWIVAWQDGKPLEVTLQGEIYYLLFV